jgi:Glycosyl hydrolases family 2/Glycosyl hydrolases family 2, TIM barrel domain
MLLFPRTSSTILALLITLTFLTVGSAIAELPYLSALTGDPYVPEYGVLTGADTTQTLSLSGSWELSSDSDEWKTVSVPGCWASGEGGVVLRRQFSLSQEWAFNHHRIVFWGVRANAAITLNGRLLKTSEGDWPRIIIDLPEDILRFDRPNDLQVELDDRLSARDSIPLKPKLYDPQAWSGIFADVLLLSVPTVTVEDIGWATVVNDDATRAEWTLDVDLRAHAGVDDDSSSTRALRVFAEVYAPGDSTFRRSEAVEVEINALETESVQLTGSVRDLQLWSISQPRLYTATIVIQEGSKSFSTPIKVGFRNLTWVDGQVVLNGAALEFRGIDYRQESYRAGGAIRVSEIESDLSRIRNQGFNLVRIVGSVPHPATYDICDRLGLLLLPGSGLRGVPIGLISKPAFASRLESMLRREIKSSDHHPSVIGWELVDWAPLTEEFLAQAINIRSRLVSDESEKLFVGFATDVARQLPDGIVGLRHRVPYLFEQRVTAQSESYGTWLVAGLGALASPLMLAEDSLQSEIRQSDALVRQINAVRELPVAGFIIDGYNDRKTALPMLIAGAQQDPGLIRRGLVTEPRDARIAWQRVGDLLGQVRIDVPVVESGTGQFPVEFPIATLVIGGLLLLVLRQNNVFRHNLRRVFAHTHGFFFDIVERRYFQGGQTLFVAIIFAAGQAVLLASLLNHSRFDFGLDYLFTLVFPFPEAKALLVYFAWHPIEAMLSFTAILLLMWFVGAIVLRLLSIPFPGHMKLRHSVALVLWAATCFLPLLPLGLVFYRLLDFAWFEWAQIVMFALFWYWFLSRLSSVVRVGFRVSSRTSWALILMLMLISAGTILFIYRGGFAITDYIRFYSDVILPWIQGLA